MVMVSCWEDDQVETREFSLKLMMLWCTHILKNELFDGTEFYVNRQRNSARRFTLNY